MRKKVLFTAIVLAATMIPSAVFANHMNKNAVSNISSDKSPLVNLRSSQVYWRSVTDNDSAFVVQAFDKNTEIANSKPYTAAQAEQLRKEQATGTITPIETIPAKEIKKLAITSSFCGIAVEPVAGDNIIVSYAGVKDPSRFQVDISSADGILSVNAFGKLNELYYIDVDKKDRVNTIQIQVPKSLGAIAVDDTTSAVLIENVDVPVNGETVNGMIKIKGTNITTNNVLSCVNGNVFLLADSIAGHQDMDAINGNVRVLAKNISANANLSCINGIVSAEAETLSGNVSTSCINGNVAVTLTKKPLDLTFEAKSSHNGGIKLPSGWENKKVIGNGTPKLTMETLNGNIALTLK